MLPYIILFLVFLVLFYVWYRMSRTWHHCQGQLHSLDILPQAQQSAQTRWTARLTYHYQVAGRQYEGHHLRGKISTSQSDPELKNLSERALSHLQQIYTPGTPVRVWYDRQKPELSCLHPDSLVRLTPGTLIFLFILILAFIITAGLVFYRAGLI